MPWAQGGRAFKSPRPDHPYVTDLFALFAFGAPSAPVANWGVLGFPEALTIYNFIYSRFPCARDDQPDFLPQSPSMHRLTTLHAGLSRTVPPVPPAFGCPVR